MRRFGYLHSDNALPSMFARRLTLLLAAALAAAAVLGLQTYRLTILEGDRWQTIAERSLYTESFTPTTRGRITDRKGRVLAEDQPAFDLLVSFDLISGARVERLAEQAARQEAGPAWSRLSPERRAGLIAHHRPAAAAAVDHIWNDIARILEVPRADLDQQRDDIKRRVQRIKGHLWSRWLEERHEALVSAGRPTDELDLADVASPIREEVTPHAIATGINEAQAAAARRLADNTEGITIDAGTRRAYPLQTLTVEVDTTTFPPPFQNIGLPESAAVEVNGLMPHVLGRMRPLNRVREGQPLDTERRPERDPETGQLDLGHYRTGDTVGGAGIEASREDTLRGLRGHTQTRLDTGRTTTTQRTPGRDVELTIDAMLQARIHAALDPALGLTTRQPWHKSITETETLLPNGTIERRDTPNGTPLAAAVAVLDIETAGVLALVSHPSYTRQQLNDDPASIFQDPVRAPWVNRALAKPYAPGSIVKPLILCAAVTDRIHNLNTPIETHGHLFENNPTAYRDWIFKQYNTTFFQRFGRGLYADEAIGVSSNIYFYTLGMNLGPERIARWYQRFGVGKPFDLGIGIEYPGNTLADDRAPHISDAILMGIGQGPVDWTPLHAADAYATLARSGTRIYPRIDRDDPPRAEELHLDPAAVDAAIEGLRYSIEHEWGTAHHAATAEFGRFPLINQNNFPRPLDILAKTGTATAAAVAHDPDGPEGPTPTLILRDGDHAWFVALVGPENQPPRYALSVLVEYAGSGGRVAGPIAEQVIHALFKEGYL